MEGVGVEGGCGGNGVEVIGAEGMEVWRGLVWRGWVWRGGVRM